MKLSVGFFAGLAAADVSVAEPVKSLQRLTGFSAEIFNSVAFDHKPASWRTKWIQKFQNNAGRMERNVGRKCGFYDADMHTFDYEYDVENACTGIKMIIDGFSRWSENHLSRCNGQRRRNHQQNRMTKWGDSLAKVLDCKENVPSYTFVIPGDDWYMSAESAFVGMGESFQFSTSCNPDWKDADGDDCDTWIEEGWCLLNNGTQLLASYAVYNEHGILETALNCPECGCDTNGAENLNDVYANDPSSDMGRTIWIGKN